MQVQDYKHSGYILKLIRLQVWYLLNLSILCGNSGGGSSGGSSGSAGSSGGGGSSLGGGGGGGNGAAAAAAGQSSGRMKIAIKETYLGLET